MLLAILDFARIASALAVVVGVTSHLGSRAALSPRRCGIASAEGGGRAIVASKAHTRAAFVAGARQAPVGRTALDEWVSPTKATRTRG